MGSTSDRFPTLDASRRRITVLGVFALMSSGACFSDPGYNPSTTSSSSSSSSTSDTSTSSTTGGNCGDGTQDMGEECDEGELNADNAACTSECRNNVCGDGLQLAGVEACDEMADTPDCDDDCTLVECGDGHLNVAAGESCDGDVSNGSCDASCEAVCDPGFASCNGQVGCETPVFDDPTTCGGCDLSCATGVDCVVGVCGGKRVFVTDAVYPVETFGGVFATIHDLCQTEATAAGLDGTYRAWVSDGTGPEGFVGSSTPYVRMDGVVVANDFADLTDGEISAPINLNASGGVPNVTGGSCHGGTATCPLVYSGIGSDGSASGGNCALWSDTNANFTPGNMNETDERWTAVSLSSACGTPARLYCFEQ